MVWPRLQSEHQSASTQAPLARATCLLRGRLFSMGSTEENVEEDLRNQHLTVETRNITTNCQRRKYIMSDHTIPAAPTAEYWLRGRPASQVPAKD